MIRPIEPSDHAAWRDLWAQYFSFYETDTGEAVYSTTWSRLLDPREPVWGAVALDEAARVVGLVHYLFHRTTWAVEDTCYLQDLFVSPQVRGKGHARQLIDYVAAEAAARNCIRVYWQTRDTNTIAQALYDRVAQRSGFIQYRLPLGGRS
jgi:ribosomal protein S18 acetylase RimI-like enzyme